MVQLIFSSVSMDQIEHLNVHNLWINKTPPEDYQQILELTSFDRYIDQFHKNYLILRLTDHELKWITEAFHLEKLTNRFSPLYEEDLDELVQKYKFDLQNKKWFVRTPKCSLKTGKYKIGPYTNLRNVIISMVTSHLTHNPIDSTIYFMPWIDLEYDLEFRVFVYKNKINGMSQQHIHDGPMKLDCERNENVFMKLYHEIKEIQLKLTYIDTYTMDIGYTINGDIYFIELNPFGAQYSAGSSLFHWITDFDILNDTTSNIVHIKYIK